MVETGTVDFRDLEEPLQGDPEDLKFEQPLEDDEPTVDELSDRIVEALSMWPSLIIVDDIDSLPPDSQRETVAALSAIALRTVGRELAPSRILMTSRIDQGQPPTRGREYLRAGGRGVQCPRWEPVQDLRHSRRERGRCSMISGRLHRARRCLRASILRLVKLGESLRDVVETWRGQDGEEVRRFAFEREITRLSMAQSRLLYAVLLLGETSIRDLTEVLGVTAKAVRDNILELQAYHLIASGRNATGDTVIDGSQGPCRRDRDPEPAPRILCRNDRGGVRARFEEHRRESERCGTWHPPSGSGVGPGQDGAAVALARDLRRKFARNGDVACLLGTALMRTGAYKEAERELEGARRLECGRVELLDQLIEAKMKLNDWVGVYELTRALSSNHRAVDKPLEGFLSAVEKLMGLAKLRGDARKASDLAIEAVEKINAKMSGLRLEPSFFERLKGEKFRLAREYISLLGQQAHRPGNKLQVFEGVVRLASEDVILADLLREGMQALGTWWTDVEGRSVIDLTACSILSRQLQRLRRLEAQYASYAGTGGEVAAGIAATRRDSSTAAAASAAGPAPSARPPASHAIVGEPLGGASHGPTRGIEITRASPLRITGKFSQKHAWAPCVRNVRPTPESRRSRCAPARSQDVP